MIKFFLIPEKIYWKNPQVRTGKIPDILLEIGSGDPDYIGVDDQFLDQPEVPSYIKMLYELYRQFLSLEKLW